MSPDEIVPHFRVVDVTGIDGRSEETRERWSARGGVSQRARVIFVACALLVSSCGDDATPGVAGRRTDRRCSTATCPPRTRAA